MNKKNMARLFMVSVLILGTLVFVLYAGGSARALGRVNGPSLGEVCYAIADEDAQGQIRWSGRFREWGIKSSAMNTLMLRRWPSNRPRTCCSRPMPTGWEW
jgi:hypothetical protein